MPEAAAAARRRIAAWRPLLLCVLALSASGCRTFDDARVLQTLNQRGFGRKYAGDANEVLTFGVGDSINWKDPINPTVPPGTAVVGMDGVIHVDMIRDVYVLGFTVQEIEQALNQRFSEFYKDVHIQVMPGAIQSKRYFLKGEVGVQGEIPFLGDTTVWDAVVRGHFTSTADLDDIYVIRPDPRHPLIIPVDLEKMLENGDSTDNITIREDDIVVVNPNFAGLIRNGVLLILQPLQPILLLAISVRNIRTIGDSFRNNENFYIGNNAGYGGGGYGGYGGGVGGTSGAVYGENGDSVTSPANNTGGAKVKPSHPPAGDH